ncbi:MAG: aminotransferase class V-fold PLP-dependent enzyme [Bacteroidota bacterium]
MLTPQSHLFQLDPEYTYLNCAYMSPMLKSVEEAGMQGLLRKRTPHLIQPADFFDEATELKARFAQLIETDDPERICLVPAVSYGISLVAKNIDLQPGEEVLVLGEQFPSNYYPWERLAREKGGKITVVPAPTQGPEKRAAWNEAILAAIRPQTRVVAMGHVHWTDGTKFDLKAIRAKSREVGALLIIDGTQSVGAMPFSIKELEVDALFCGAYKWLLGPYGSGIGYLGPAFDGGVPLEESWLNRKNSIDFSGLVDYESEYEPKAQRHEMGQRANFITVPMMKAAIEQILEWTPEAIQTYTKALTQQPLEALREAGFQVDLSEDRPGHLFGIRLPGDLDPQDIKQKLLAEKVVVSIRGTAVRVAPHVFATSSDMDKLVNLLLRVHVA